VAVDGSNEVHVADSANNLIRTTRIVVPALQFAVLGNQMVLSWPTSAEGFLLEESPVIGPGAFWSLATNGVVTLADNFVRTNALTGSAFYRLHLP
jgi:hypothetical protein